jgi:hypothetical protein
LGSVVIASFYLEVDMSVAVEGQGAGLRSRLWKTKGSRFVARERLRATNTLSITTVTMLSIYVIVSSIVLLAFSDQLNDLNEKWLNIINVGLSVLIIAFSLIEASRDHLGAAETMNQSGLRIGEMYGVLSAKIEAGTLTADELESFEGEYASVLRESKLNHSNGDYTVFRIENWKEFGDEFAHPAARIATRAYVWLSNYWLYIAALFAFPIVAVLFGGGLLTIS